MTGWPGRQNAARRGISRVQAQWLICTVVVICALGFYGYKHWNAPPSTAIVGKAWVIDGDTVVISGTHISMRRRQIKFARMPTGSPGLVGGSQRANCEAVFAAVT